jgi:hypothetical protein
MFKWFKRVYVIPFMILGLCMGGGAAIFADCSPSTTTTTTTTVPIDTVIHQDPATCSLLSSSTTNEFFLMTSGTPSNSWWFTNQHAATFSISGDGGSPTYDVYIDGTKIGRYGVGGVGNKVCVTTQPLSDGTHEFKAIEGPSECCGPIAKTGTVLGPQNFVVDTVAPPKPTVNVESKGTTFIILNGIALDSYSIQVLKNDVLAGGNIINSDGSYRIPLSGLTSGTTYRLQIISQDKALNQTRSDIIQVTTN